MTALDDAKAALVELRASAGYKAAKAANPNPAVFAATHAGRCETHIENVIAALAPKAASLPLLIGVR